VELQPVLGVDEVFLGRVLAELGLKGCDDPADAVVSRAARQYGLDV